MGASHASTNPAILVTGGAGYVGSVTVRNLLAEGRQVVVLDDLSRGHREVIPPGVRFVHGSIADPIALNAAFSGPEQIDSILHFAAYAYVGESMTNPGLYFANNVGGTINLCREAVRRGVQRFVFSSSCTVYGIPESCPIDETTPLSPVNPYGESKRQCEEVIRWMSRSHGFHYALLRYFNAAGAMGDAGEKHHPETHLIPLAIRAARAEGPGLAIYGGAYPTKDGTPERDYVHVIDLARAHILALDKLQTDYEMTLNLGSGQASSVLDVVAAIQRTCGQAVPYHVVPRRPGDPPSLVADIRRAKAVLNWEPLFSSLDRIVMDVWDYLDRTERR
ncbi:MAG: UDP-glucose 4-epimerase GalE [Myxococcales bacterium]|nr:UDP-glucose 4-epimerase GalE [Myxococcales bacterium]